jgi:FKBP-type peptidyl-prolyl cis-trans isomerase 2
MKKHLTLMVLVAVLTGTAAIAAVNISDGTKVTMNYTVSAPEKQLPVTTEGQAPLSYILGSGQMNPVLEQALYGLHTGDRAQVVLTPEQAFGPHDPTKKITVSKDNLPPEIQEGLVLSAPTGELVTVAAIEDDSVVLDLNHPFAGQNLVFDIHILDVEETLDVEEVTK